MRVHFIAIGGSAMHNMAIALHEKGIQTNVDGVATDQPAYPQSYLRAEEWLINTTPDKPLSCHRQL